MFIVKSNTFLQFLLMDGDCSQWHYMGKEIGCSVMTLIMAKLACLTVALDFMEFKVVFVNDHFLYLYIEF